MMTSSNGIIFRVTGHLCGEFTGQRLIPTQMPVTRSFDVFFDLRLNKRLRKQWWGWWFETPSRPLWRHCNAARDPPLRSIEFDWREIALIYAVLLLAHWKQNIVNLTILSPLVATYGVSYYDNLWCHQWRKSCEINDILFSMAYDL